MFGELLHETWQVKRNLSANVSNEQIDAIYHDARKAGALGGKLLGAGGGGFIMLFVPPDRHQDVKRALARLLHVPCKFEFLGSQIIFYDRDVDYSDEERVRQEQRLAPAREWSDTVHPA
jgi:D-glycero-alpha-D-manno-heptose-7-phosphate kinase